MLRLLPALLLVLPLACSDEPREAAPQTYTLRGKALGTTWTVKVRTAAPIDLPKLRQAIVDEIERNEKILSHWRPDAQLYQFNQTLTTEPVEVHPLLRELLLHAKRLHAETDGAFDPTVAPLVNLRGFGPVRETRATLPRPEEIERARRLVGMEKLELLPDGNKVRKQIAGLQIDLSGSAKGEIIDQTCARLDRLGHAHYLVEIGGELRGRGHGASGHGWKVALEDGTSPPADLATISLRDHAAATSGTYRLNKPVPGSPKPASHLLDPRTGRSVEHDLVAVNVLAPTAREADALATALLVLGPEDGPKFAKEKNLAARFHRAEENQTLTTPAYDLRFR